MFAFVNHCLALTAGAGDVFVGDEAAKRTDDLARLDRNLLEQKISKLRVRKISYFSIKNKIFKI